MYTCFLLKYLAIIKSYNKETLMKIIMNGCKNGNHAHLSFVSVQRAIEDNIEEGRNKWKFYHFDHSGTNVSECKNKDSFTTYIQKS
jgi:hypothetical protein